MGECCQIAFFLEPTWLFTAQNNIYSSSGGKSVCAEYRQMLRCRSNNTRVCPRSKLFLTPENCHVCVFEPYLSIYAKKLSSTPLCLCSTKSKVVYHETTGPLATNRSRDGTMIMKCPLSMHPPSLRPFPATFTSKNEAGDTEKRACSWEPLEMY